MADSDYVLQVFGPILNPNGRNTAAYRIWAATEAGSAPLEVAERRRRARSAKPTIEEAMAIVRPFLHPANTREVGRFGPPGQELAISWPSVPVPIARKLDPQRFEDEAIDAYIKLSSTDPNYFEALKLIVARLLRNGDPLPDALAAWQADVNECKRLPPRRKSGKPPYAHKNRNHQIRNVIQALEDLGMSATRSDESSNCSACDIVAKVLGEHGQERSYSAINNVWKKRLRRRG